MKFLHPLVCQKQLLVECDICTDQSGVVDCQGGPMGTPPPCETYPCSQCSAGQTYCSGTSVYSCRRAAYSGKTCDEICVPVEVEVCTTGCEQDPATGVARCAP